MKAQNTMRRLTDALTSDWFGYALVAAFSIIGSTLCFVTSMGQGDDKTMLYAGIMFMNAAIAMPRPERNKPDYGLPRGYIDLK